MRKLFSLCTAVLVALAVNAKVVHITPTHCHEGDREDRTLFVTLDRGVSDGDTVLMASGDYLETQTVYVKNKVVIMPEEGAKPVVKQSGYFKPQADVKFIGIKFVHNAESNGYCMYLQPGCTKLEMQDCEITNFKETCIMSWEDYALGELILNNCYIHDNIKSVIYVTKGNIAKTMITNSTIVNNDASSWDAGIIDIRNADATYPAFEVKIDHCTFYNNKVKNGDYADVRVRYSNNTVVSNCIFALAAEDAHCATYLKEGGSVNNCLAYQYTKRTEQEGHYDGATRTNCSMGDPKFKDAANGDYTLLSTSPARTLNGGDPIGDPRWSRIPTIKVKGDFGDEWALHEATLSSDKKFASVKITLPVMTNKEFGVMIDEYYCKKDYNFNREYNACANAKGGEVNMKLTTDVAGDYIFNWYFDNDSIEIIFPDKKYYLKNNWDRGEWAWKEMTKAGDTYKLENVVVGSKVVDYNTLESDAGKTTITVGDEAWKGDAVDELDTVNLVLDPAAGTITATLVGEYKNKVPDGYYLVGKIKGADAWDLDDLNAEKCFATTEVAGELKLEYNLDKDDAIKVVDVYRDGYRKWYKEGTDNNYVITEGLAGSVTIYFRPAGNDAWGYYWFEVVKKDPGLGVDNIEAAGKAVKVIENGQLYIIKNGVKYNVIGSQMK